MKKILINVKKSKEFRVAIVDKYKLYDINIFNEINEKKKYNIYKGKIARIEPSLEAVFIDYGSKLHGLLPIKEISNEYFKIKNYKPNKFNIKDILINNQDMIVQIYKEERDNKGAVLTTFINLFGKYLILMPNNSNIIGISKKIKGINRNKLKCILNDLNLPKGMGLIIRTSGSGKSYTELKLSLLYLTKHWYYIQKIASNNNSPFLIYQENNFIFNTLRDHLQSSIYEILIDNKKIVNLAKIYVIELGHINFICKIKFYNNGIPLFKKYKIDSQISSIFQKKIKLYSGGSITIDTTEALTSIDINSSKSHKGLNTEETALNTNLEAIYEITRQLRLRDLGGLIVIDFIDMNILKHQKKIENRLKNIICKDRAEVKMGKISKFGLLELSRQRIYSSSYKLKHYICPYCYGSGFIQDIESISLLIFKIIEEELSKINIYEVHAIVPEQVYFYMLNKKHKFNKFITKKKYKKIKIIILPNKQMKIPNFHILKIKKLYI